MDNRKERYTKYLEIAERAEKSGLFSGESISLLMDIKSADDKFGLKLDEWIKADDDNFAHDINGIMTNINREVFPAVDFGFFVPRFAG